MSIRCWLGMHKPIVRRIVIGMMDGSFVFFECERCGAKLSTKLMFKEDGWPYSGKSFTIR